MLETNAAAHKKQRNSLSPDGKSQILNKDTDAHRKKQESLSPEDKDLFVKDNTAPQHKHCKSLSPDQNFQVFRESLSPDEKVQIITIDAAAHKKQYELLPPEKKAILMETRAEQCHEHFTEEEKKFSAQIRSVAVTLYEKVDLNRPTVEFLREHFYKDPTLALAYFYCCSTDPHVGIFNDKLQPDIVGSVICNRISNLIGSPNGQEEAMLFQETFTNLDQSHARIAACASCCERLLSADGQQGIVEMKIDNFPSEFLLTESQKECLTVLPQYIVQNHIQVVNHNGTFYHLNPDLVFGVNQIVLCHVCAENPMTKDQESIAAGNDYGRLGSLKPLNGTTWNACVPVRLYNINLRIQADHSMNHSIAFPMNGPVECLKKLPCLDEKYCLQVTFLGPQDEWTKKAGKYKYLYKMDTEIAYDWLRVWVDENHPSVQKLHQ
jgi:hypothetical protein